MSNQIEQIRTRVKIEQKLTEGLFEKGDNSYFDGQNDAYDTILRFINSLLAKENPILVPSDVQEAAEITHDEGAKLADGYQHYLATGLTEGWERPIGPKWMMKFAKKRFIAGAEWQRERLMKDAVEIDTGITINRYTKQHILHISSTDEHIQHLPQGEYKAIIIKKEK